MGYEALTEEELQVGKPVTNSLLTKIKANFDYLYGLIAIAVAETILNPSFEIDVDENGIPDNWTRDLFAGGSGAYEETDVQHGAKAYKFIHPGGSGNGGGYLTSDYIEMAGGSILGIQFWLKTTNSAMKVQAKFLCYDAGKIQLEGADAEKIIYSAVLNPTVWALNGGNVQLPADTRYIKIQLLGGVDDTNEAGTVYFDFVSFTAVPPYNIGNNLVLSSDAEVSTLNNLSYVKVKEISLNRCGGIRIKFDLKRDNLSYSAKARIYKNGSPIGTERTRDSASYETFSEDFVTWLPGDKCQIYAKSTGQYGIIDTKAYVRNFRIYSGTI